MTQPRTEVTNQGPRLDLALIYTDHNHGDLRVILTWELHRQRPCIVIIPAFKDISPMNMTPCVFCLDELWVFDEKLGSPEQAIIVAVDACNHLEMNPWEKRNVFRIIDIVRKFTPDVIKMPPMPPFLHRVVADAILVDPRSGKAYEKEITSNVH